MKNFTRPMKNKFKKEFYSLLIILIISFSGFSQNVGINATGALPNAAAGLDVSFPDKGILIPRVSLTSTVSFAPLLAHVAGMIVYNTATIADVVPGFYYDNGTKWVPGFLTGTSIGDMLYWNGTNWVMIPIGLPGQYLQISGSSIPMWGTGGITTSSTIITTAASSITGTTATSGGNITSDGGSPVLTRGICWNTSTGPTIANNKTTDGSGIGVFVSSLTGLLPATTYYVRAYTINATVVTYGNEVSFMTTGVIPTLAATTAATVITGTSAISGGNVTNNGGSTITERGVCYSTTANPTTANTKIIDPSPGLGVFVSNLTGLTSGTTYYVRSYATNSSGTGYGTQISFTTLQIPPTIITTAASSITSTTATSGGSYTLNGGGGNLWNYGIAYSTVPNSPTPTYVQTGTTPVPTPFTTNLTGLLGNTTYYIRAYIQGYWNGAGSYDYGNELSFTTAAPVLPTVSTTAVTNIGAYSATSGGNVTNNGGAVVTTRGICWGTSPNPDTLGFKSASGSGNGIFVISPGSLLASTTYHIRAYAVNSIGVAYGNDVSFTTCGAPLFNIGDNVGGGIVFYVDCTGQAGLIAAPVDQGSGIPYGCEGTVTGATGTAIFSGVANTAAILAACNTPGIAAQLCASYNGGGFTDWYLPSSGELQEMYNHYALLNLTSGLMTYWSSTESGATVASGFFVNNGNGYPMAAMKGYGTQMVVRAIRAFSGAMIPQITTDPITNITSTGATCGGNITSDGGAAVTARGVCWSTSPNPTIANSITTDGTGTGAFVSSITGLTTGVNYYVRAYATNSVGTAYGNEVTVMPSTLPIVTTNLMGSLVGAIAVGGGSVDSEGASPVTAFGLCWSTSTGPTVLSNLGMTTDATVITGSTPWPFSNILTGLTIGTTYYVRAYATNGSGTAYGTEEIFVATAATLGQVVTFNIGSVGNGVVFNVDGTGLHGLIADQLPWGTADWGCPGTLVGASGTAIGTGQTNTSAIIASNALVGCISGSAFGTFAAEVTQFDGPDWYLPAKDEMTLLWNNRGLDATLDANLSAAQGLAPFWSSSEVDSGNAWYFDGTTWFNTGLKTDLNNAWAIRSF